MQLLPFTTGNNHRRVPITHSKIVTFQKEPRISLKIFKINKNAQLIYAQNFMSIF